MDIFCMNKGIPIVIFNFVQGKNKGALGLFLETSFIVNAPFLWWENKVNGEIWSPC